MRPLLSSLCAVGLLGGNESLDSNLSVNQSGQIRRQPELLEHGAPSRSPPNARYTNRDHQEYGRPCGTLGTSIQVAVSGTLVQTATEDTDGPLRISGNAEGVS